MPRPVRILSRSRPLIQATGWRGFGLGVLASLVFLAIFKLPVARVPDGTTPLAPTLGIESAAGPHGSQPGPYTSAHAFAHRPDGPGQEERFGPRNDAVRRATYTAPGGFRIARLPPTGTRKRLPTTEAFPEPTSAEPEDLGRVRLPLGHGPVTLERRDGLITLSVRDAPLRDVLTLLAESQGLSILTAEDVNANLSGRFSEATFEEVMEAIFAISGYTWVRRNNIILVTSVNGASKLPPQAQGREVAVFPLNYVAAADIENVVSGLLSAVGQISIIESSDDDSHRTREQVIVEDIPPYLERVADYVARIDQPPRQVLIEAHILEVVLKDDASHGVDFAKLSQISGMDVLVATPNFNNTMPPLDTFTSKSYNIGILKSGNLSGLVEALTIATDAKTLASPKVLALNGQESYVQIGEKLGYFVTTTTETSTTQSVEFLDTGVVLNVTPYITDDNLIMMTVKPEVSDGSVDALGLPSERTTEVATTIMLQDGTGMVIGGLIKETLNDQQQRIPFFGALWRLGNVFRRSTFVRERKEIIIALVPHIVTPHSPFALDGLDRTTTRIFEGPLCEVPRPWEPTLDGPPPHGFHLHCATRALQRLRDAATSSLDYLWPLEADTQPHDKSPPLPEDAPWDPSYPPAVDQLPLRERTFEMLPAVPAKR